MLTITSKENQEIKRLTRLLDSRSARQQEGAFVVEGLRICMEAVGSPVAIAVAYFSESFAARHPAELAAIAQKAGESRLLCDTLAARLGDTKSPQGVFCICSALDNRQDLSTIGDTGRLLLLHCLQDPGNVGTILRTAEALGMDGVLLSEDCPELTSPKVLRATMGGVFRQPASITSDMAASIGELRRQGVAVYAAALTPKAIPLGQVNFPKRCAIVIGNEGNGLPQGIVDACDGAVVIPMAREGQSLNAAAAACILMWELCR